MDDERPVRYDPYDATVHEDPYPLYGRLRDEDPVHHVEHRDYWVLSRFADVFAAAGDGATFSSAEGLTFEPDEIAQLGLAPTMVMMDRPEHTTYRRLVSRGFTPRQVAELEPAVRAFVRERVAALTDAGEGDFIELLAGPLPTLVVATYLGVPEADRAQFDAWSAAIVSANARGDAIGGAAAAVAGLYGYFRELVARRRREPADDMLSDLVAAAVDGEPLDLVRILGYCFVMIAGGNDTVTGLLGAPVQGLCRTTTREVAIGDRTIPAGRKVHLLYGSANRDPREFGPTADRLDVTRRVPRMMAFGGGPHHCIGAAAARLQGRVALEELLAAAPNLTADPDRGRLAPGPFVRRYESLPVRVTS
jgi:cytochrome P450 family 130